MLIPGALRTVSAMDRSPALPALRHGRAFCTPLGFHAPDDCLDCGLQHRRVKRRDFEAQYARFNNWRCVASFGLA
jgi:hypothetical protein